MAKGQEIGAERVVGYSLGLWGNLRMLEGEGAEPSLYLLHSFPSHSTWIALHTCACV